MWKRRLLMAALIWPTVALAADKKDDSIQEIILDKGLHTSWQDWGWAQRTLEPGQPAKLHFNKYAGWILAHRDLEGHFTALQFNMRAPRKLGDFLEVSLVSAGDDAFPAVQLESKYKKDMGDGWVTVRIPMSELNPGKIPFDRVKLRAFKNVADDVVELDRMILFGGPQEKELPPDPTTMKSHAANLQVDCRAPSKPISPYIYGIAYNPHRAGADAYQWDLGITSRRWGGNPASRYNWKLGNAWNTALDWYFMNVNYTSKEDYSWKDFLDENRQHQVGTALTVPMLGWVAKDTESYSYPVSVYGPQQYANNDIGNGRKPDGKYMGGSDPKRTSLPSTPQFVAEWVTAVRQYNTQHHGVTHEYILDNEPALWNSTHNDVHPKALTYDELLEKTLAYGSAVRKADPQAVIAGPAEWGWPGYFYSAKDAEAGFTVKPDRRAHGDVPLVDWYLKKLHEHEQKTGERVLDVLDFHYYPQVDGTYGSGERVDPKGAATRIRVTRSLWDPTYKDESWIADKIELLPRMQKLIDQNYPGLKISIGEYNFGGEKHISGALAEAESLGRFGQYGVYSAYYWTYPPVNSPTYFAFRAYRNYDGRGAHFLEKSLPARSDSTTSLFASQNATGDTLVAIALNLDAKEVADLSMQLQGCGNYKVSRAFMYLGGVEGFQAVTDTQVVGNVVHQKLLPYSINVFELKRQ